MMSQAFDLQSLPEMPWKNGGGRTCAIVCVPAGSGLDDFDWRVSLATIEADGPFSAFPGVDRHLVLVDGGPVQLRPARAAHDRSSTGAEAARGDDASMRLARAGDLASFDGGAAVDALLGGRPARVLNLMLRRGRAAGRVDRCTAGTGRDGAGSGLWLVVRGRWRWSFRRSDASHALGSDPLRDGQGARAVAGTAEFGPGQGVWWLDDGRSRAWAEPIGTSASGDAGRPLSLLVSITGAVTPPALPNAIR